MFADRKIFMWLINSRKRTNHTHKCAGFFACVFAFLFTLALIPSNAFAEVRSDDVILGQKASELGVASSDCPNIDAQFAYVVSQDGTVYFERNAGSQTQIASLTKIMTALVALEYGDPATTTITVSYNASHVGESSAQLQENDSMNLETALKALMIVSGNDAAQAIAESMGDSVRDQLRNEGNKDVPDNGYDAFIYAMNKKAQELGMTNTHFTNPHGLDFDEFSGDMYSTAYDVSLMCRAAMEQDLFKQIVSTKQTTVQITRNNEPVELTLESTDVLLGSYEGACGIKTGNTNLAGPCFAGACERDGEILYAIVLKSNTEVSRFTDAKILYDWVYENEITYPLIHSDVTTTYLQNNQQVTVPVVAEMSHKGWVDSTFPVTLSDTQASVEVFRLEGNVSQEFSFDDVTGDVHIGQKVGTVTFMQHNEVIAEADIIAAAEARGPNFFESVGVWWDRVFRGFAGQQTEAQSTIINTTPLIYGSGANLDEI